MKQVSGSTPLQDLLHANALASAQHAPTSEHDGRILMLVARRFHLTVFSCSEGSVNVREALKLPHEALRCVRSPGCLDHDICSVASTEEGHRWHQAHLSKHIPLQHPRRMPEIRLFVVHYSKKHRAGSCAIWEHNTAAALSAMEALQETFAKIYKGTMVPLVVLFNTDDGEITLKTPSGDFYGVSHLEDPRPAEAEIESGLRQALPKEWPPLAALTGDPWRDAFYHEMAGYLAANARHIQETRAAIHSGERLIYPFGHQERILFIGNGAVGIDGWNRAFHVQPRDPMTTTRHAMIGFRTVALATIREAIRLQQSDFSIPIVFGISHSDKELCDERLAAATALALWKGAGRTQGLQETIRRAHRTTLEFIAERLAVEQISVPLQFPLNSLVEKVSPLFATVSQKTGRINPMTTNAL